MFAGAPDAVAVFKQQYEDALRIDQRWVTLKQEGGALAKSIDRAQQFLVLSALLTLLLAIAAVAVAMSHYCRSRHTLIAVLKTLGAGRRELRYWVVGQWAVLMAAAMVAGSLLGLIFDAILMSLLAPLLPKALPDPGIMAVGVGTADTACHHVAGGRTALPPADADTADPRTA